jgi:hypothetical protein
MNFKIPPLIRDSLITLSIGLGLVALLEMFLIFFYPQTVQTDYVNNQSLGIKDATLGYYYRPGAKAFQKGPEFSVEYEINQDGIRDKALHPMPKPSGLTRILLLGDSFTFGIGNDYDQIWPVLFENNLRKEGYDVDVVKAGAAALDTQKEILFLERLFPKYNPDIVIVGFLPNDLHTNTPIIDNTRRVSAPLEKPKQNDMTMKARNDKETALQSLRLFERLVMSNDALYTKLYLMTIRKDLFVKPLAEKEMNQLQITEALLSMGLQYTHARGADFLVLSIPQQFQVIFKANNEHSDNIDTDFIDHHLMQFSEKQGFPWITTLPEMVEDYRKNEDDLYFRIDGHLNTRGNALVAESLTREFLKLYKDRLKKIGT